MVTHRIAGAPLDFDSLRVELAVPGDFAADVLAAAAAAATSVVLPARDATDIPLVTLDPPGSRDLDQAVHIARDGSGFRLHYAIADVASFAHPNAPIDLEAHRRGTTIYLPDAAAPMLPQTLSNGAASLLAGQLRPAVLWRIALDSEGVPTDVEVGRARVRSRAQLDYPTMQRALEQRTLPDALEPLSDLGPLRRSLARERGAIDLDLPSQDVVHDTDGWRIELRVPSAIEQYNAEISLLTGMCAADLMLRHGYGILRTVPPPSPSAVSTLRGVAHALGLPWPADVAPGDALANLDRTDPRTAALLERAAALLRGAGYMAFDGAAPAQPLHAGIGAPYTHATAPLRRLVDRYSSEICLAHSAGEPVPDWVRAAVPLLPAEMGRADQHAHAVDRAVVDATEAFVLRDRVGEQFTALVLEADAHAATVLLDDPPVRARCTGDDLPEGQHIRVVLEMADVRKRTVRFAADSAQQVAGEHGDGSAAQRDARSAHVHLDAAATVRQLHADQ